MEPRVRDVEEGPPKVFLICRFSFRNSQLLRQMQADAGTDQSKPDLHVLQLRYRLSTQQLAHGIWRVARVDEEAWKISHGVVLLDFSAECSDYSSDFRPGWKYRPSRWSAAAVIGSSSAPGIDRRSPRHQGNH